MSQNILFILHEATESGAPNVAINFMIWLRANTDVRFDCLILHRGTITPKLKELCDSVYFLPQNREFRVREKVKRLITQNKQSCEELFFNELKDKKYNIVYLNSIFSLSGFQKIEKYFESSKKILHLHEAEFLINYYNQIYEPYNFSENINHIISVSKTAMIDFLKINKYPEEKISVVYPHVEKDITHSSNHLQKLKNRLDIGDDCFIIGNIGNPHLIKSSEILPILASLLKKKYADFNFKILAVGGANDNIFSLSNKIDIEKLGVTDNVILVSHKSDVTDYLQIMNLYAMISREESFSLMTVKAALSKIAILSFRNNGGPSELLTESTAFFVDYLDINSLADKIFELSKTPQILEGKKTKAYNHFSDLNSSQDNNLEIWSIIKELI